MQGILQFRVVPKVIFEALSENTGLQANDLTLGMFNVACTLDLQDLKVNFQACAKQSFKDSMLEQVRDDCFDFHHVHPCPCPLSIYVHFLQGNDVYKAAAAAFRTNRSLIKLDLCRPEHVQVAIGVTLYDEPPAKVVSIHQDSVAATLARSDLQGPNAKQTGSELSETGYLSAFAGHFVRLCFCLLHSSLSTRLPRSFESLKLSRGREADLNATFLLHLVEVSLKVRAPDGVMWLLTC